jgi:hypothetical protein
MGIFKRKTKESELPEDTQLPDLPQLPNISKDWDIRLPAIPSITKEIDEKSNQKAIKDIINPSFKKEGMNFDNSDLGIIRPQIKTPMTREIGNEDFTQSNRSLTKSQNPIYSQQPKKQQGVQMKGQEFKQQGKQEPVFVRVDKYKNAIDKLQDIKQKLMEIDKLLSDVKEIKSKEDFEINEWNKEIQSAKSKIDMIDKMLFSQIGE